MKFISEGDQFSGRDHNSNESKPFFLNINRYSPIKSNKFHALSRVSSSSRAAFEKNFREKLKIFSVTSLIIKKSKILGQWLQSREITEKN